MKSILEKALVHLLNEESEKAQELMHQFVVERARSIHESLREGDDADMDDTALEEEFFTEADLDDAEAADHLEDDLGDNDVNAVVDGDFDAVSSDQDAIASDDDAIADDDAAIADDDAEEADEGDISDKIDNIEDEIKSLQAEFDKIMAELGGDDDLGDDDGISDDITIADDDAIADDDDFEDVSESLVADLKKVTVPNEDGKGATGEKLGSKVPSPIAKDAKPRVLAPKNTVGHTGFERQTPPAKKDGPDRGRKYSNDRVKATSGNSAVPASGPKGAELAKPIAGNTKSVISGKKK